MKEIIIKLIKGILEEKEEKSSNVDVTLESNLRDLGLSSFDLASLTVMIEDEYDVDIFEEGLVSKVSEIVDILEKNV